jgi:hypothetical protein
LINLFLTNPIKMGAHRVAAAAGQLVDDARAIERSEELWRSR